MTTASDKAEGEDMPLGYKRNALTEAHRPFRLSTGFGIGRSILPNWYSHGHAAESIILLVEDIGVLLRSTTHGKGSCGCDGGASASSISIGTAASFDVCSIVRNAHVALAATWGLVVERGHVR